MVTGYMMTSLTIMTSHSVHSVIHDNGEANDDVTLAEEDFVCIDVTVSDAVPIDDGALFLSLKKN
jgi:hypothetical protein